MPYLSESLSNQRRINLNKRSNITFAESGKIDHKKQNTQLHNVFKEHINYSTHVQNMLLQLTLINDFIPNTQGSNINFLRSLIANELSLLRLQQSNALTSRIYFYIIKSQVSIFSHKRISNLWNYSYLSDGSKKGRLLLSLWLKAEQTHILLPA